ncbi:MarR family winged helix-turn-helix transcriptional regulator [Bombilactobacillus mellis]|uniref:MarR family winged helix-turn-helix transcriptional regulator n=1 Tax=Bombilactobacillus mellis TaxID=1218508 RepID=UPI00158121EC|nr:MarR family winged helix-turn-helix transcriptional regulator [Bombilactobacillus mellis]NUF25982.1 winged helix-turn-helix transcriptional regulator [Bombilactobacillus mellis]
MVHDTGRLLKIAARQLTKNFDNFARQYGLTATQMSIIDHLGRKQEEVLQRDLEQEFNIRRSTATLILQRMEKKDLIKRTPAQIDARQRAVVLTDKGKQLVGFVSDYMQLQQTQLQQQFSNTEIALFEKILHYYMEV